VPPHIELCM